MKLKLVFTLLSTLILISGCASNNEPTPKLHHALLSEPNSKAVERVIERLMHIKNVNLDNDVFLNTSTFTLKNSKRSDASVNEQLNFPDQFELMIKAQRCYVRHLDSKATAEIKHVTCKINL